MIRRVQLRNESPFAPRPNLAISSAICSRSSGRFGRLRANRPDPPRLGTGSRRRSRPAPCPPVHTAHEPILGLAWLPCKRACGSPPPPSLPLDRAGGLGGHVVDHAVDAADLVDDPVRPLHVEVEEVRGHTVERVTAALSAQTFSSAAEGGGRGSPGTESLGLSTVDHSCDRRHDRTAAGGWCGPPTTAGSLERSEFRDP